MKVHPVSHATRAFVGFGSLALLLFSVAVRARVHLTVVLPSHTPLLWFLGGSVEDLAVISVTAAGALGLAALIENDALARASFGVFVAVFCVLDIGISEAVMFLGGPVRPEDFRAGIPTVVIAHSMTRVSTMLLAGTVVALVLTVNAWAGAVREGTLHFITAPRLLLLAAVAIASSATFTDVHRISTARNGMVALIRVGHEEAQSSVAGRVSFPRPQLDPRVVREIVTNSPTRKYLSDDYPLAYLPGPVAGPTIPAGIKPNIVILLVEGLRAEEVGCYNGDPPGVTPNIDRLARLGIRVDPVYSAGTFTASAELASLYGIIPVPKEILLSSRPELPFFGLPEALRASGWKDAVWIHNGDVNFYRRDLFYKRRGVTMVAGEEFPRSAPKTSWGYSDRMLARVANEVLARSRQPFLSIIVTVSNHHPFEVPEDAVTHIDVPEGVNRRMNFGARTRGMIQTVHYTDEAIGEFMQQASRTSWFKNTIFVIVGDHGSAVPPLNKRISTRHQMTELMHRVPLIIYSPLLQGGLAVRGPASQADIVPTLLDMMNIRLPRSGVGVSVFSPEMNDRALVMWAAHIRTLTILTRTRAYHALYRGDNLLEKQRPVEYLIDTARDPEGTVDYIGSGDPSLEKFRRLSRVYREVYTWVVTNGKAGLPPGTPARKPRKALLPIRIR